MDKLKLLITIKTANIEDQVKINTDLAKEINELEALKASFLELRKKHEEQLNITCELENRRDSLISEIDELYNSEVPPKIIEEVAKPVDIEEEKEEVLEENIEEEDQKVFNVLKAKHDAKKAIQIKVIKKDDDDDIPIVKSKKKIINKRLCKTPMRTSEVEVELETDKAATLKALRDDN